MKINCTTLFYNHRDGTIKNEKGTFIPLDDAREAWDTGQVKDCNKAFQLLATQAEWDREELSRIYNRMLESFNEEKSA